MPKICEWNVLGVDLLIIAVFARQRPAPVCNNQLPDLQFFGLDRTYVDLCKRDFIEKPIRSCCVGYVFRALGEQDRSIERMAKPFLAAAGSPATRRYVQTRALAIVEHGEDLRAPIL